MSQQPEYVVSPNQCQACNESSSWGLLHDFIRRVAAAEQFAFHTTVERTKAEVYSHQMEVALTQCKVDLATAYAKLDEERLHHQATTEVVRFEQDRLQDTTSLITGQESELRRSREVINDLREEIALLWTKLGAHGEHRELSNRACSGP